MSCMFPQFVYQLQLDFYYHCPSARDLSFLPRSTSASGNCLTLTTPIFVFTRLRKPSRLILRPCSFPVTCRMRIYLPIFKIPGPQQKAGAAHELKPLSIPSITSGNLQDPVFAPGGLGLIRNRSAMCTSRAQARLGAHIGAHLHKKMPAPTPCPSLHSPLPLLPSNWHRRGKRGFTLEANMCDEARRFFGGL